MVVSYDCSENTLKRESAVREYTKQRDRSVEKNKTWAAPTHTGCIAYCAQSDTHVRRSCYFVLDHIDMLLDQIIYSEAVSDHVIIILKVSHLAIPLFTHP